MAVRMEAEEKAQQGLRAELAEVIAERNRSREQLTVKTQELDELRAALESAQQAEAARQQDGQEALQQLQRERDEALERLAELQQQVDQLRAEAEVTRGLVDMQSPAGVDAALREQLEQAKKNVDVAVRLRSQAEAKNAELQATIEGLHAQLQEAGQPPAAHIPSLDENDPHVAGGGEAFRWRVEAPGWRPPGRRGAGRWRALVVAAAAAGRESDSRNRDTGRRTRRRAAE
jgi:chromosome segregation ATPase